MSITDHWHDPMTVSLLGTDRRDPPDAAPGPLADVGDDALAATPSERMLAAVGACVAARRAGIVPLPPAVELAPPDDDDRPMLPPAAAHRWRSLARVGGWLRTCSSGCCTAIAPTPPAARGWDASVGPSPRG
jgi:hypothetical protein